MRKLRKTVGIILGAGLLLIAVLIVVGVSLMGTHQSPPELNGPRLLLGPPFSEKIPCGALQPTTLAEPPPGQWARGTVDADPGYIPSYGWSATVDSSTGASVTVTNGDADNSSTLSAYGGANWETTLPINATVLTYAGNIVLLEGYWYHSAGIGDAMGDSAHFLVAISFRTGRIRWWTTDNDWSRAPELVARSATTVVAVQEMSSHALYADGCTYMYVVNLQTGHQRWMTAFSGRAATFTIADSRVFLRSKVPMGTTATLAAWDSLTGRPL